MTLLPPVCGRLLLPHGVRKPRPGLLHRSDLALTCCSRRDYTALPKLQDANRAAQAAAAQRDVKLGAPKPAAAAVRSAVIHSFIHAAHNFQLAGLQLSSSLTACALQSGQGALSNAPRPRKVNASSSGPCIWECTSCTCRNTGWYPTCTKCNARSPAFRKITGGRVHTSLAACRYLQLCHSL